MGSDKRSARDCVCHSIARAALADQNGHRHIHYVLSWEGQCNLLRLGVRDFRRQPGQRTYGKSVAVPWRRALLCRSAGSGLDHGYPCREQQHIGKDKVNGGSGMNFREISTLIPLAYRSPMPEDYKCLLRSQSSKSIRFTQRQFLPWSPRLWHSLSWPSP